MAQIRAGNCTRDRSSPLLARPAAAAVGGRCRRVAAGAAAGAGQPAPRRLQLRLQPRQLGAQRLLFPPPSSPAWTRQGRMVAGVKPGSRRRELGSRSRARHPSPRPAPCRCPAAPHLQIHALHHAHGPRSLCPASASLWPAAPSPPPPPPAAARRRGRKDSGGRERRACGLRTPPGARQQPLTRCVPGPAPSNPAA